MTFLFIGLSIGCAAFLFKIVSAIVQSLLSSNFAVIPQFLVKGIFFNQIQVDV